MTYPMKCRIHAEGAVTRIDVYDDIGSGNWLLGGGLSAAEFAAQLGGVKGPVDVHINSYGGDVGDGITIASNIRSYQGPKRVVVDGFAASIASVIAQAGDERVMQPGAMMMVHDALADPGPGNEADMLDAAATLGKHSDNIAAIYAARAGGTPQQWRDIMRAQTWYTADEAVAAGLADRVGDGQATAPPGGLDLAAFTMVPGRIAAAMRALPQAATGAGDGAPVCKTCGGRGRLKHPVTGSNSMSCPSCNDTGTYQPASGADGPGCGCCGACTGPGCGCCAACQPSQGGDEQLGNGWVRGADGKIRFDPDGDDDDDSDPEQDTDHDYFDEDGNQIKPIPPCPVARNLTEAQIRALVRQELLAAASVDSSPWDASKAWHNGTQADDPAAFYKAICAGEKTSGDPATQAHWALPYRYTPSSPPNAAAVRNGLARINQAQGLANKDEAEALLQRLMKQINPDYEPADHTHHDFAGMGLADLRAALKGAHA